MKNILKIGQRLTKVSRDCKQNIQHVETSVASHHKQFERPIASQLRVNYVQRVYGALVMQTLSII